MDVDGSITALEKNNERLRIIQCQKWGIYIPWNIDQIVLEGKGRGM